MESILFYIGIHISKTSIFVYSSKYIYILLSITLTTNQPYDDMIVGQVQYLLNDLDSNP